MYGIDICNLCVNNEGKRSEKNFCLRDQSLFLVPQGKGSKRLFKTAMNEVRELKRSNQAAAYPAWLCLFGGISFASCRC